MANAASAVLAVAALGATVDPEVQKCGSCDKPAVYGYQWDWGEQGLACAEHAALLQQTATQLSRTVNVFPLQRVNPEPLTRDERTRLKATALVLEEELEEAKSRGLDLYRVNGQLRNDVQLHKVRNTEAEAQLKDAHAEINRLNNELQKRELEHGELVQQLEEAKTLAAFSPSERRELGLGDDPTVVDGTRPRTDG